VTEYRLVVRLRADADIAEAVAWYEARQPGLGIAFLEQLRTTYDRIAASPDGYQKVRGDIRRAVTRQFPYGVYFVVDEENAMAIVMAVLHRVRIHAVRTGAQGERGGNRRPTCSAWAAFIAIVA
jgi:plasmid stabilization system protein ParE